MPTRRAASWGKRPDRALTVYSNLIRRTYKKTPIILGGIEASLRRLAHYDYWSNSLETVCASGFRGGYPFLRNGGESILAIAEALDAGIAVSDIGFIPGTVYKTQHLENVYDYKLLPPLRCSRQTRPTMRKAFMSSTATRIPSQENGWWSPIPTRSMWYRTARCALEPGGDGRGLCLSLHADLSSLL